ncbi:MAG: peptidylprolyl isomerase [Anaerolineales bacterium]|nr:peptidylprolyl isomerase [Anaerolineales bacterium]
MAQLAEDYPEDIRIAYRHFPLLSIHDKAGLSTQASEAAGAQGKFWEMHDLLFATQGEWSGLELEDFEAWLEEQAGELDLDVPQFVADLNSDENVAFVQQAWDDGSAAEFPGTPLVMINGRYYNGPTDYWNLEAITKMIQMEDKQFTICPPMTIDPAKSYEATIHTENGDIVVELFPDVAPIAVNSFIFLADNGWYDGVTFHRVLPGFVAQGGDPSGTGFGGPGYAYEIEISEDVTFDQAGLLSMANSGPTSNGSQFFITLEPLPNLDGGYTIFGRVISGMDVVEQITPRDPNQNPNLPPGDTILGVTIREK